MEKRKIGYYIILLTFYIVTIFFVAAFGAMFLGIADPALIITFGVINLFFFKVFFKINFLKSILLGFLVSSIGLIFSYLLWVPFSNFTFSEKIVILPLFINAVVQTIAWKIVESILIKNKQIKIFGLFVTTVVMIFLSFNMWDYWTYEKYYNSHNKVLLNIKFIDSETQQPIIGDTVILRSKKQPLYGLMIHPLLAKNITDESGIASFKTYKGNFYSGAIYKKNNSKDYFEIESKQIIDHDTIVIKTTSTVRNN